MDDFTVAAPTEHIANIIFDHIDDFLTFPLKTMGLVNLFNGIDVLQTRDYIKISVETYITRMSAKHLNTWMDVRECSVKMTPLPRKPTFVKTFLSSVGDPDETQQKKLAARMGFG